MPERKALIVAGSAGPEGAANSALQRFGFSVAENAPSIAHAAARLREENFDLLVVPLQDVDPVDLVTLEREVRKAGSTYVIGTAAQADPELILRAMRTGIQEFLVFPPDPKDFSAAVDRLLRRSRTEGAHGGVVVAVYSAKGGLGTTTTAVNLAYGFAKNNHDARVALADLVVSGGDIGVLLDIKRGYDIGDLVAKGSRVDADVLYSLLTPCTGGVWALPSGEKPESLDAVDAAATANIIQQLRSHFGFTVLDCEHHLSERTVAALDAADRIVLLTQLNIPALRSTQRTLGVCRRLGYGDDKLVVVVNRFGSGDVVSLPDAARILEHDIAWRIPNDYRATSSAITRGVPLAEHDAGSPIAKSYAGLAAKLGGVAVASNGTGGARGGRITSLFGFGRKG